MKTSIQWIEAAKTVLHIKSDRELCAHFGWNRNTVPAIRSGLKYLNNTEAANLAEVLNVNPLVIIADAETERAKDEKTRQFWAHAAKKFAGIAAAILLIPTLWLADSKPSQASIPEVSGLYIMSIL